MTKKNKEISEAPASSGRMIPRYPLGPTSLEIMVMVRVVDGTIAPWEGSAASPEGRRIVDDAEGYEHAVGEIARSGLVSGSVPLEERAITVRGGLEITLHAIGRAHRAVLHIVGGQDVPSEFQNGWIPGKIGVPKGDPPVRHLNLARPGL